MDFLRKMFCCCKKSKSLDISKSSEDIKNGSNINKAADLKDDLVVSNYDII